MRYSSLPIDIIDMSADPFADLRAHLSATLPASSAPAAFDAASIPSPPSYSVSSVPQSGCSTPACGRTASFWSAWLQGWRLWVLIGGGIVLIAILVYLIAKKSSS